jgi:PAS domain S-box-containing protein
MERNALPEKSTFLINNSADIMGIVDVDTLNIEEINPAFTTLSGFSEAEVRDKSLLLFLDPEDQTRARALKDSCKEQLAFEMGIRCKNGSVRWLAWQVVLKENKWFVNARDLTRQKAADEQIRELSAALQRNIHQLEVRNQEFEAFSHSVSHDLRAPLRAVRGNVQILREDYGEQMDVDARKIIEKIDLNAKKMDALINDLLSFSRIGKKEVRRSLINMQDLVRNVFSEISSDKPLTAEVSIHPLPDMFGDFGMISQVWSNLVSNAVKYSANNAHARIEVGFNSGGEYYIEDNGAGFDMAYAEKLFGTFQRLHESSEFEGNGMGLAITHRIIAKHGGTIRAVGTPGKGATFAFRIPETDSPRESETISYE